MTDPVSHDVVRPTTDAERFRVLYLLMSEYGWEHSRAISHHPQGWAAFGKPYVTGERVCDIDSFRAWVDNYIVPEIQKDTE